MQTVNRVLKTITISIDKKNNKNIAYLYYCISGIEKLEIFLSETEERPQKGNI